MTRSLARCTSTHYSVSDGTFINVGTVVSFVDGDVNLVKIAIIVIKALGTPSILVSVDTFQRWLANDQHLPACHGCHGVDHGIRAVYWQRRIANRITLLNRG